jgi:hypothetical protein
LRKTAKVVCQNGVILPKLPEDEHQRNATLPVHDRAFLLHGSKRNEVLGLLEIEQYGLDGFGDADYISIYGMKPREWYGWTELHIYDINERGRNHGVFLGSEGWAPTRYL